MTPRLGVSFVPWAQPPEALPDIAAAADRHLQDLCLWEDCFAESGVATSAAALALTSRVRVQLGLMPTPLRVVGLAAMEIATLQRLFPGRFVPGVGHGVQEWMGQAGVRAASPMTLLAEYVAALRALLAGQEVSTSGRYVTLDRVRLHWPPPPGPLYIGGTGPKTLEFAAQHGDGVMLAGVGRDGLDDALRHLEAGIARRPGGSARPEITIAIGAAVGPDALRRLEADVADYGLYAAAGSVEQIADVVAELGAGGIGTVNVVPARDETDVPGFIELLGRQVRPLLS